MELQENIILVIDTNKIIAALIKDSLTRKIILHNRFITPDFTLKEIKKYTDLILKKSGLNVEEFNLVLNILFETIEIIPIKHYEEYLSKASLEIDDIKDVPFVALAMAKNTGIWTDDAHFNKVNLVKIYKTEDIIKLT